ncbi:hypothetical protein BAJUN_00010 [Bajunvirus bajun]|uniref:Uncharacterized protein n=1 Tax=Brevundimonas phage vB_BgoS-Bajun TaxID=2948594 RepID=A0A9E7ST57_9CAUD|nr:hypothetical protein BAJUN_00010 [Brevundimonas phage vB_BgoS-Bajun]
MQKALLASVLETRSHLFFDDVVDFNNRVLLMAITSRHIGGRQLGSTKTIERPNNFGWIATGNNPAIMSEMGRRIVDIRMNAKTEDIQNRTFRHPDFMQWLKGNRGEIVHAILTLIAFWLDNGAPKFTERKRASFEDWSEKVGGVLQLAGIEGFLDNRRSTAADMDEAAKKVFVREWNRRFGIGKQVAPIELWSFAFDAELDIVTGNNDDIKKAKFAKTLPTLDGRTWLIKDTKGVDQRIMVRQGMDDDMNVVYYLERLEIEDQPVAQAA